jgi:hypothetical protein
MAPASLFSQSTSSLAPEYSQYVFLTADSFQQNKKPFSNRKAFSIPAARFFKTLRCRYFLPPNIPVGSYNQE